MSEIVRIAVGESIPKLEFPPCCAQCGTTKHLVPVNSRLGKIESIRANIIGSITMRSQVMYLNFKMCRDHAGATRMANGILSNSPVMKILRGMVVYCALLVLPGLMALLRNPVTAMATIKAQWFFVLLPVIGIFGLWGIVWARSASALRPLRFDPDKEVIEVSFMQEKYAAKFRLMNREATNSENTAPVPWYMKGVLWYGIVSVLATFVLGRAINY